MPWNKTEIAEAEKELRKLISPGTIIYTTLVSTARSGMSRVIACHVMATDQDGKHFPRRITHLVAAVCGYSVNHKAGGIRVGGCGFDAGFQVVYELGSVLFPDGFECIGEGTARGERCPSNDHSNGDRDYTPHLHKSGGYALRREWL